MKRPNARSLVWLAAVLAAGSVAVAALSLPGRFAGDSGLSPPTLAARSGEAAAPVSIDPILELSPFGRLVRAATGRSEAQETTLGLVLHGVVITVRPEASSAIVSGPTDTARVYRIGENITESTKLGAVFGDHVVLLVDGRSETLSFPRPGAGDAAAAVVEDTGVAALRALTMGGDDASGDDAGTDETTEEVAAPETSGEDIAAAIERYRSDIRDDPQTVLDALGLVALDDGYGVDDGASPTLLRAGLRPGDLVSKVNGQQVGDIEADRQYFDDVTESGRARLEVVRDGRRIVLTFPLR